MTEIRLMRPAEREAGLELAFASPSATGGLTVNSAPSAVDAYERLGFVATAREQEKNGIRYVAMRWDGSSVAG